EDPPRTDGLRPTLADPATVVRVDGLDPAESPHGVALLAGDVAPSGHVVHGARRISGPDHDRAGLDQGAVSFLAPRATELGAARGGDVLNERGEPALRRGNAAHVQPQVASRIVLIALDRRPLAGGATERHLELAAGEEGKLVPHDAADQVFDVPV